MLTDVLIEGVPFSLRKGVNHLETTNPFLPSSSLNFIWYFLTGTWAGEENPACVSGKMPRPVFQDEENFFTTETKTFSTFFLYKEQRWSVMDVLPPDAIGVFSLADGSLSAWNAQMKTPETRSLSEVLYKKDGMTWETGYWSLGGADERFRLFLETLNMLIFPRKVLFSGLTRSGIDDSRDMITFRFGNTDVPLVRLSEPFLRTLSLVWRLVREFSEWDVRQKLMGGTERPKECFLLLENLPGLIRTGNLEQLSGLFETDFQIFLGGDLL